MSDRIKLMDLLKEGTIANAHYPSGQFAFMLTEHLIKNGVVIQKQGEWVCTETYPWGDVYACTQCGCEMDEELLTNYCPDCGAKMKEVTNEVQKETNNH